MTDVGQERPPRFMIKDRAILAKRQRQLVDAATKIFTERGYAAASVNEIADEGGFSVGALYKYVPSKEYLLWMVMDRVYSALEEVVDFEVRPSDSAPARLVELISNVLSAVDGVIPGIRLMYREYGDLTRKDQKEFIIREDKILRLTEQIIEKGNAAGEFDCDSPRLAALNILATTHWWSLKRWALGEIDLVHYIEKQAVLMLRMVGGDAKTASALLTAASAAQRSALHVAGAEIANPGVAATGLPMDADTPSCVSEE